MSDFAKVMEMALEAGTPPEDITGRTPPSLMEQLAENEKEQAKAAASPVRATHHLGEHPAPPPPPPAPKPAEPAHPERDKK